MLFLMCFLKSGLVAWSAAASAVTLAWMSFCLLLKERQCFKPGFECTGCVKNGLVLHTRVAPGRRGWPVWFLGWLLCPQQSLRPCPGAALHAMHRAITDSVGVESPDMMLVVSFTGLSALATSSAFEMSISVSVQMSPEHLHLRCQFC